MTCSETPVLLKLKSSIFAVNLPAVVEGEGKGGGGGDGRQLRLLILVPVKLELIRKNICQDLESHFFLISLKLKLITL
jgi:hypothetical protein